jgi:ATP-dependent Clp protease ATP-binding subunit ClpA
MDKVRDRLEEKNLELKVTEEGVDLLAELGYNPEMGARPLRRVIQQKIENQLSDALLEGRFKAGDMVIVDASYPDDEEEEGEIVLEKGDPSEAENDVKPEDTEEPVPVG